MFKNLAMLYLSSVLIFIGCNLVILSEAQYVERFRGIPLIKKPLYEQAGKSHFQCLDNSMTIPFDWVNDDYCDCRDGSDEPGTSACSNGRFHCINLGHKSAEIPSSRVNDQICDCCDGSDEWASNHACPNYCAEAGKVARQESERLLAVQTEGFQKRTDFVKKGKELKAQNQKKLDEFKAEKETLGRQLEELDMVKQVAEKSEKEAKDVHTERWKVELEAKDKLKQKEEAFAAFEELDVNKDKKITHDELINKLEFDKNLDGKIQTEEIAEYFGDRQETELEHFVDEIWNKIKSIYKPTLASSPEIKDETSTPVPDSTPTVNPDPVMDHLPPVGVESAPHLSHDNFDEKSSGDDDEPEDEVKEDEVEDFDTRSKYNRDESYKSPPADNPDHPDEKMPEFDEETKKLIADADQARKEYDDVDRKIRNDEEEIRKLEEFLKIDFGPDDEFSHLHRECFEFSDLQYTYGLCLFDRTYQKPKGSSHSDVNLGHWDSWIGTDEDRYSKQMYKNGQTCWNGPARSTEIKLTCGLENRLVAASEPGRCEYAMEFETPAVCKKPLTSPSDEHLEL